MQGLLTRRCMPLTSMIFIIIAIAMANAAQNIDSTSFHREVKADSRCWVLEFYSNMCGSCQEFSAKFEEFAESLSSDVVIGKVNIDTEEGIALAVEHDVLEDGIPGLYMFKKGRPSRVMDALEGDTVSAAELKRRVVSTLAGHARGPDGYFLC